MDGVEGGGGGSRRKMGRLEDGGGGGPGTVRGTAAAGRDPLAVLGPDIFAAILAFLDAPSAARSVVVSRGWQKVVSRGRIWRPRGRCLLFAKCTDNFISKMMIVSEWLSWGRHRQLAASQFSLPVEHAQSLL